MENDEKNKQENEKKAKSKLWIVIILILLMLLGLGYVIFYTPIIHYGVGVLSPELREEVEVLVIGMEDEENIDEEDIKEADAIVLANLQPNESKVTFRNVPVRTQINDQELRHLEREEIESEITELYGITSNYYFVLSYESFKELIDSLGGVEIALEEELQVPDLDLDLNEGSNLLSGDEALNYARWFNYPAEEIERLNRQQEIIRAVVEDVLTIESIADLPETYRNLVDSYDSVETNLDKDLVFELLEFYRNRDDIELEYDILEKID